MEKEGRSYTYQPGEWVNKEIHIKEIQTDSFLSLELGELNGEWRVETGESYVERVERELCDTLDKFRNCLDTSSVIL